MGILDLTSEVLTEYKADASQHKRELQELKNFQAALGEAEGHAAAERNQSLTEWIEKLGKVTLAVVAVKEVSEFLWDGYKDGIKDARLATQAMGVDIEKLKEATKGLITENQLLELAAKANRSAFKNSQEDIENAGKAIVALQHRGADAAEAMDAVTKALVEGKTKGLEPYGIVVDKNISELSKLGEENLSLAQKTEIHTKAMEALKTVADEVSGSQDGVGDSMQRAQVKLADAWDDLKKDLGKLVTAFQPVIEVLAKVLNLTRRIAGLAAEGFSEGEAGRGSTLYHSQADFEKDRLAKAVAAAAGTRNLSAEDKIKITRILGEQSLGAVGANPIDAMLAYGDLSLYSGFNDSAWNKTQGTFNQYGAGVANFAKMFNDQFVSESSIQIDAYEWKRDLEKERAARLLAIELANHKYLSGSLGRPYVAGISSDDNAARLGFNTDTMNGGLAAAGSDLVGQGYALGQDIDYRGKLQAFREKTGVGEEALTSGQKEMINAADMKQVLQYAQEFLNQKTDTVLGKIFGPVGEFDLYKKGFESLTGAVGTMYEAVVSGSESGIGAFQKFIAAQVAAEGKLMMVEAVKEAAYAVGNLAYGNFAGAAAHAQAAAEFAAGAVLAGVVASELGYGGGGGGGSGPGRSGGGGFNVDRQDDRQKSTQTVIVYGDSFAEDSPRSRQIRASKLVAQATGTSGGKFS